MTEVVEEAPVLICRVKLMTMTARRTKILRMWPLRGTSWSVPESPGAGELGGLLPRAAKAGAAEPTPTELAFWLTSLFPQDPQEQQLMLQIDHDQERLERLKEFRGHLQLLRGGNSIKSALSDE